MARERRQVSALDEQPEEPRTGPSAASQAGMVGHGAARTLQFLAGQFQENVTNRCALMCSAPAAPWQQLQQSAALLTLSSLQAASDWHIEVQERGRGGT